MSDGHLNKCKDCTKKDVKTGNVEKRCLECGASFYPPLYEIKRGGGKVCSRKCFYPRFRKIVKVGEDSPNWKGNKVGRTALHNWVEKHRGKPKKCEHCGTTKVKKYEWANKSQKYKRELDDWLRLCTKCHHKYDRKHRFPKWKEKVQKLGWNVKKTV